MSPEPVRRLGAMSLPIHGPQASILFKEGSGYRVAISGGKHAPGDILSVIPGVRVMLKHSVGGSNIEPGEPQPREHLWLAVQEGHALDSDMHEEEPARKPDGALRRLQAAGVIPVRHRRRRSKALAA